MAPASVRQIGQAPRGRRSKRGDARGDRVGQRDGLGLVLDQDQGAEPLQALAGEVAPAEVSRAGSARASATRSMRSGSQVMRIAGARGVLGLADEVGGDEPGVGGPVGDEDDLARPGDAVDVDLAVDVPLGQRHEQVPRADDLVDRRDPLDPISQRRHGLRAADPVDLGHAQRVAGGEEVVVVSAEFRGRDDHGDLRHARRLGRDDRHQERRRIGRRAAGDADADPPQAGGIGASARTRGRGGRWRRGGGCPTGTRGCCRGPGGSSFRYAGSAARNAAAISSRGTRTSFGSRSTPSSRFV